MHTLENPATIEATIPIPSTNPRPPFAAGEWPRQRVLREVFALFEENGIDYCVLNGYERLYTPGGMGGGDLDCIVAPDAVPGRVAELLYRNADRIGGDIVSWEGAPNHYIKVAARLRDGAPYLALLDLHPGYEHYGRRFFTAAHVLRGRRRYRDVWAPAPDVEFVYYFVKKLLGGRLGLEQTAHLSDLRRRDPEGCSRGLARFWSAEDVGLIAAAADSGDWTRILAEAPRLRAALLRRAGRRHPFRLAKSRFRGIRRRIKKLLEPHGLHVVLLGPDGVGKSTVIEGLTEELAMTFTGGVEMDTPAGLINRPQAVSGRPHEKVTRGLVGSVAKAAYWFLYYAPGYAITVLPGLLNDRLHLSHRYLVDALVDAKRYRYGGPRWLLRLVWTLAVKPDMIILLDAPAETIQARKQEVAPEETARQCAAYRAIIGPMPEGSIIDATQPVERVVADVRDAIIARMIHRTAWRLGAVSGS